MDLKSPLALRPISESHSPELIDNLYLTGIHSTDSSTNSAFTVHIYLPNSTTVDIVNLLSTQLVDMQKERVPKSSEHLHTAITVEEFTDTHVTTYLDDEPISFGIY
jgi:hypothetical protein